MPDSISLAELKEILIYDPETGNFYHSENRRGAKKGDVAGSLDKAGYIRIYIKGKRFKAHRLAIFYMTGKWPKAVDHKNRKRSDNRWCNIRPCTLAENNQNPGISSRNKSGAIGVHWHERQRKWIAAIQIGRKKLHLGSFASKEEAKVIASVASRVRAKMLETILPNPPQQSDES